MALRRVWLVVPLPGTDNSPRARVEAIMETGTGRRNNETADLRNTQYYNSEGDAISACERLATQNPLKPYAVMGIVAIRETAQPKVIAKQFTNDGELVIV